MSSTIITSFSGALQASLSVLLVIFYGVVAAQFNLLDNASAKRVSYLSVKLFLPFLLITKVGKELTLQNASNYVPILSKRSQNTDDLRIVVTNYLQYGLSFTQQYQWALAW